MPDNQQEACFAASAKRSVSVCGVFRRVRALPSTIDTAKASGLGLDGFGGDQLAISKSRNSGLVTGGVVDEAETSEQMSATVVVRD